jgi:uncharacterized protein (TIGR04255 family)
LLHEDSRDALRLQLASLAGLSVEAATIILDLDYFLVQPGAVALDEVATWLTNAHARIEEIFEGCITDQLRQNFEEEFDDHF